MSLCSLFGVAAVECATQQLERAVRPFFRCTRPGCLWHAAVNWHLDALCATDNILGYCLQALIETETYSFKIQNGLDVDIATDEKPVW